VLGQETGVWDCTFVGACTEVCPKDVDPAAAIQRSKVDAATHGLQALVWPFGSRA
jgi:fumarate reductase iron-sulfur subunit